VSTISRNRTDDNILRRSTENILRRSTDYILHRSRNILHRSTENTLHRSTPAEVLDGDAIAAQAAMARTNKDLFIASPLELAQSCRVMIGGLATLTECLLVLHARRRWLAVIGRAASPSETARVNIVAQVR